MYQNEMLNDHKINKDQNTLLNKNKNKNIQ